MRSGRLGDEDTGSVLLLMTGLVPVLFMLLVVGTDAAVLFTHRRSLAAEADAAATAAAQTVDLAELYAGTAAGALPLDCGQAQRMIDRRFSRPGADHRLLRVKVRSVHCDGTSITVGLSSPVVLPFVGEFGVEPEIAVVASAAARSPFR